MSKTAHILAIRTGTGTYRPIVGVATIKKTLADLVDSEVWVGPRPILETMTVASAADKIEEWEAGAEMPAFLQVIPYILFRHKGRYLRYLRTSSGGDNRLHGKISVGIGGHIDLQDISVNDQGVIDLEATLSTAALRETQEEIGLSLVENPRWEACLYAQETAVDTVHIGIVGIFDLTDQQAAAIDANHEIGDHRFATPEEIILEADNSEEVDLETWSRWILNVTNILPQ